MSAYCKSCPYHAQCCHEWCKIGSKPTFLLCLLHHNGDLPGHKFYVLSRKKNYFELCSSLNQSDSGVIPGLFFCFQIFMATHCLLNNPALLINSTLLCICLGTQFYCRCRLQVTPKFLYAYSGQMLYKINCYNRRVTIIYQGYDHSWPFYKTVYM